MTWLAGKITCSSQTTEVWEAKLSPSSISDFHFLVKHTEKTGEPANMPESCHAYMNKGWEAPLVAAPTISSKPSLVNMFCFECLWLMKTTELPPADAGSLSSPVPNVSCRITQPKPTHLWFTFQRQNHWHFFCNLPVVWVWNLQLQLWVSAVCNLVFPFIH